jgi:4-hydroxybenzoate polyprenyltransferase
MTIPKIVRDYARLVKSRGRSLISYPLTAIIGYLVSSHSLPPILPTSIALMSLFIVSTCVYIYNDIIDSEMDKLNLIKQHRPLPSGEVPKGEALKLVYITALVGTALSLFTKLEVFILTLAFIVLFLSYSNPKIRLKKRIIMKEGTVAAGLLISTFIGGLLAGAITLGVVFQGLFFFFGTFVIYPIFVDYQDRDEDEKYGMKTLAIILGWKTKMEMAIFYILSVMVIATLAYSNLGFNVIFPVMVVGSCLLFLRFLVPIINGFEKLKYTKAMKSMFVFWMFIQTALIVGSFPI